MAATENLSWKQGVTVSLTVSTIQHRTAALWFEETHPSFHFLLHTLTPTGWVGRERQLGLASIQLWPHLHTCALQWILLQHWIHQMVTFPSMTLKTGLTTWRRSNFYIITIIERLVGEKIIHVLSCFKPFHLMKIQKQISMDFHRPLSGSKREIQKKD